MKKFKITITALVMLAMFSQIITLESFAANPATGTKVKMGQLYMGSTLVTRPNKPWAPGDTPVGATGLGTIATYDGTDITMIDSSATDINNTQWVAITDGSKQLYIADRVMITNISWNEMKLQGLIYGKNVKIDGNWYRLRTLTVGATEATSGNQFLGGVAPNEFDRYINNSMGDPGLKTPSATDIDANTTSSDYTGQHNTMWNWDITYTWGQEKYTSDTTKAPVIGATTPMYYDKYDLNSKFSFIGWRPVLEPIPAPNETGLVSMGTLTVNGVKQLNPTKPWRNGTLLLGHTGNGDIPVWTSGNITITDSDADPKYQIKWRKIVDNGKTIYIADRNILQGVSWSTLDSYGILSKDITIDGKSFRLRLPTGGNTAGSPNNSTTATPVTNEWDKYINNDANLENIPKPVATDLDGTEAVVDYQSDSNQVWNWYGESSFTSDFNGTISNANTARTIRGGVSPRATSSILQTAASQITGYRPVLEEITIPQDTLLEKFGTLYLNGTKQLNPTYPWAGKPRGAVANGNIPVYTNGWSIEIRDSDANDAYKIRWRKIVDGSKTLYISDRNLVVDIAYNDLLTKGWLSKIITIDGKQYKARLLSGGNIPGSNPYSDASTPTTNEWDRYVANDANIAGNPSPSPDDLDSVQDIADNTTLSQLRWNWLYIRSWTKDQGGAVSNSNTDRAARGYSSIRHQSNYSMSSLATTTGWRPVLEEYTAPAEDPTIVKLGTLYIQDTKVLNPTYPWVGQPEGTPAVGNIPVYTAGQSVAIRDSDSDDAYKIRWHKIVDGAKTIYIADRNILNQIPYKDLALKGLTNSVQQIDGKWYRLRLLAGSEAVNGTSSNPSNALDSTNEWDKYICNYSNIPNIPNMTEKDKDGFYQIEDYESASNRAWNWFRTRSLTYSWDTATGLSNRAIRGGDSIEQVNSINITSVGNGTCWRPVLEEVDGPAHGDTVKFGSLSYNDATINITNYPWKGTPNGAAVTGSIIAATYNNAQLSIRDTKTSDASKIFWVKIVDGAKTKYIADRILVSSISFRDLNNQGLTYGKIITVDGKKYRIRLIEGGTYQGSDYGNATDNNSEWNKYICNSLNDAKLPTPYVHDAKNNTNSESEDFATRTNEKWNWVGQFTHTLLTPNNDEVGTQTIYNIKRGYSYNPYFTDSSPKLSVSTTTGWRPLLEEVEDASHGDLVTFGTMTLDGALIERPFRPWTVNLTESQVDNTYYSSYNSSNRTGNLVNFTNTQNVAFINTNTFDGYKLMWRKVVENGKTYYVSDRPLINNKSPGSMASAGLKYGKIFNIDGVDYKIRQLSAGTYTPNSNAQTDSEFNRWIRGIQTTYPYMSNNQHINGYNNSYGQPYTNLTRINEYWNIYLSNAQTWYYMGKDTSASSGYPAMQEWTGSYWGTWSFDNQLTTNMGYNNYNMLYYMVAEKVNHSYDSSIVKMGTLYINNSKQANPTYPWYGQPAWAPTNGNVPSYSTNSDQTIEIRDSDTNDIYKIKWRKIIDGTKTLYIADRSLATNVSWNDLVKNNLVYGQRVKIEGNWYNLRLLTGGDNYKTGTDNYSGGTAGNEWDNYVVNERNLTTNPAGETASLDSVTADDNNYNTISNQTWNWANTTTWCQDKAPVLLNRVIRGGPSVRYWGYTGKSGTNNEASYRPVLEPTTEEPKDGEVVSFGTLTVDNALVKRPKKPWNGTNSDGVVNDLQVYAGQPIGFSNTSTSDENNIKWVKLTLNGKKVLVADRNLLRNVSYNQLNTQGFLAGKRFTIDGKSYNIRLLTGGTSQKVPGDIYQGAMPTTSEYEKAIANVLNSSISPVLTATDKDSVMNTTDLDSLSNYKWNWTNMQTITSQDLAGDVTKYLVRGGPNAIVATIATKTAVNADYGFRPVLELNSPPELDTSLLLDNETFSFDMPYKVIPNDSDGDTVTISYSIDEGVIESDIGDTWNSGDEAIGYIDLSSLSEGQHTIDIWATDPNGAVGNYRTIPFTIDKTGPVIPNKYFN